MQHTHLWLQANKLNNIMAGQKTVVGNELRNINQRKQFLNDNFPSRQEKLRKTAEVVIQHTEGSVIGGRMRPASLILTTRKTGGLQGEQFRFSMNFNERRSR